MSESDPQKSMIEHVRELRNRVMVAAIALLVGFAVAYSFVDDIYQFLTQPLLDAYPEGEARRMIYTGLTEAFFTYIKLSFFVGLIIVFPVLAWQLYIFLAPGLYKNEKTFLLPFLMLSPALFIAGIAVAYYGIFPLAWQFFLSFEMPASSSGQALPIMLEARVSEYLSLVIQIMLAFGLAFQLPVVIMLLVFAGLVESGSLKRSRKYAVIGMFALAAIVTPPDVISQIGLALPLLLLYEAAIFAAQLIEKRRSHA